MSVRHTIVGSPVGPLTLVGDGAALVGLYYANGWNPISIIAACHRVVGVSGSLTGYAGGRGRKHRTRPGLPSGRLIHVPGRLAQRESASLTRKRSQVQSL
jgi:hypothetical protein